MKDIATLLAHILAYDIELEKGDEWITLSNGRRVLLDANGDVKAGFTGFVGKNVSELKETRVGKQTELHPKKKLPDATKYIEKRWKKIQQTEKDGNGNPLSERKARERAARQYFRTQLQGHYVKATIGGKPVQVHFTGKTWSEFFKDPRNFEIKVAVMSKLPEIIRKGLETSQFQLPKHIHKDFDGFYHIEQKIPDPRDGTKTVNVIMDVGKTAQADEDYNQYFYTARDKKMESLPNHRKATALSGVATVTSSDSEKDSIPENLEIVKVDIKEEGQGAEDSAPVVMWLKRKHFVR